eukprot:194586-Chlamydomonas_euryale.AAC.4
MRKQPSPTLSSTYTYTCTYPQVAAGFMRPSTWRSIVTRVPHREHASARDTLGERQQPGRAPGHASSACASKTPWPRREGLRKPRAAAHDGLHARWARSLHGRACRPTR